MTGPEYNPAVERTEFPNFTSVPHPHRDLAINELRLDFRQEIAFRLASVSGVQAVYATDYNRGQVFFVWTVVAERRQDLYAQIYKKEQEIIDANENILFDFTVLSSGGKDPQLLIVDPTAQLIYLGERSAAE